jgi:phosphatidylglycerophosphate synthase
MTSVDTEADAAAWRPALRASLEGLRAAQKPPRGVSAYSLLVNRPAGRWVAAVALRLGLSPNQLSVCSGVLSLAAALALAVLPPSIVTGVAAAAARVRGFVLDSADGQLARFTRRCSRAGEWLDHMIDCAIKLALHAAVLVAWVKLESEGRLAGGASSLLLPLAFQFVAVLLFFGGTLRVKLKPEEQQRPPTFPLPHWLRPVLMIPVDHGMLCAAMVLWHWLPAFMTAYGVMFVANAAYLCVFVTIWFRQLR